MLNKSEFIKCYTYENLIYVSRKTYWHLNIFLRNTYNKILKLNNHLYYRPSILSLLFFDVELSLTVSSFKSFAD